MDFRLCMNCGQQRGFKRSLGVGTIIALLLTAGFWLLALPFYPKRCISCGGTASSSTSNKAGILLIILVFLITAIIVAQSQSKKPDSSIKQSFTPTPIMTTTTTSIVGFSENQKRIDMAIEAMGEKNYRKAVMILDGIDKNSTEWIDVGGTLYIDAVKKIEMAERRKK
ncbi:MAG: hypothetical protein HQK98_05115 [Nitrospirae bacterium]|nr:hypothetical protein [Nitrospirota bacterium]